MHRTMVILSCLFLAGCSSTTPYEAEPGAGSDDPPPVDPPPILRDGTWLAIPARIGDEAVTVSHVKVPYDVMREVTVIGDDHPWPRLALQVAMRMGNATSWALLPWWSGPDGLVAGFPLQRQETEVQTGTYPGQRATFRSQPDPQGLAEWTLLLPTGFPTQVAYDLYFTVVANGPADMGEVWIRPLAHGPVDPPLPDDLPTGPPQASVRGEATGARVGLFADLRTFLFVSPPLNWTTIRAGDVLDVEDRQPVDTWPAMQNRDLTLRLTDPGQGGTAFHHASQVAVFGQTPGATIWDLTSSTHGPTIERGGISTSRAEGTTCTWEAGCWQPLPYIGILHSGAGPEPAALHLDLKTVRAGDALVDFLAVIVFDIDASMEDLTGRPVAHSVMEIEGLVDAEAPLIDPFVAMPRAATESGSSPVSAVGGTPW